jgi:hypothetical protein
VKLDELALRYSSLMLLADRPTFQTLVEDLHKTVGDDLNPANTNGAKLADRAVVSGEWDAKTVKTPFRAFICDVLRALGQDPAAAHLLTIDPALPCTLHSGETARLAYEAIGEQALDVHLKRMPLKKYFPWQFIDTFRRYFYGPTRTIQSLNSPDKDLGDFQKLADKLWDDQNTSTGLADNELFFDTVYKLKSADQDRSEAMSLLESRHKQNEPLADPLRTRQWMSMMVSRLYREVEKAPGPIYNRVVKDIIALADEASQFWDSVLSDGHSRKRLDELKPFANGADGQILKAELVKLAKLIFQRNEGALPTPKEFSDNVARAKVSLGKFSYQQLEEKLIAVTRKDKFDPSLARWYGFQLRALADLQFILDAYKYSADAGFPGGRADVRIATRLKLAENFILFGYNFSWDELQTRSQQVLMATEPDQADNEVALLGDWDRDKEVGIADLSTENKGFTSSSMIQGFGGLTSRDLSNLFLFEYYQRFTGEIKRILETNKEEGDYGQWRSRVLGRAQDAMSDVRKPRRYLMPPGTFHIALAPAAGEEGAPANAANRTPFSEIVMAHPKTTAYLSSIDAGFEISETKSMAIFEVKPPSFGEPLYFWAIPPLKPLVAQLKTLEINLGGVPVKLDDLVSIEILGFEAKKAARDAKENATIADTPAAPAAPPEADWITWLKAFMRIGETLQAPIQEAIHMMLETARGKAYQGLDDAMRRAETQDRQMLLKFRVRPLLEDYDGTSSTFTNPSDALGMVQNFVLTVHPLTDQDLHETAIILELFRDGAGTVDLVDIFSKKVTRYELIVTWQTMMRRAVRQASQGSMFVRNVLTKDEKADDKWIAKTIPRIQLAIDAMEKRKEESQLEFGFFGRKPSRERSYTTADYLLGPALNQALENDKYVDVPANLVDFGSGRRILAGADFTIDSVTWRLVEIKTEFEFHPDWGNPYEQDSYLPSKLLVEGEPSEIDPKTHKRPTNRELLVVFRNGHELHLHENDDSLLAELSNAVGIQVIVESMAELAAFIEKSMEVMMDLAEFIPGAGQALMAARLAASLISFIASDEFAEIKEKVLQDPAGFIEELAKMVAGELFRPERIADWILLGTLVPSELKNLKAGPSKRPKRQTNRPGTMAKFAQLIAKLVGVGAGFYRSLSRVRRRGGQAYLGIESFVHIHPALLLAFELGGDYIELLETAYHMVADRVGKNDLMSSFEGFPGTYGSIIEAINSIEIPHEIIPMDVILSLILDLIIDRLGAKYKAAGKAILYVLDQLGYRQEIMKALAKQIPEAIDPNHYWGEFVDDTLAPKFNEFRDDSVNALSGALQKLGLPAFTPDQAGKVKLTRSGTDFPEAEAMLTEEPDSLLRYVPVTAPSPGAPLSAPIRHTFEKSFGHDFKHVRLHGGDDAGAVTSRYHADAITTGSHIFLKPGLDPREGRGAHVFRHELSHVLQQTGSRPLGEKHPQHAVLGQPQQGLKYSPAAESAADRMAKAAARSPSAPVRVEKQDEYGLMPAFSLSTVGRVLRRLSRGEAMTRHYEKINAGNGTAPLVAILPTEIQHQIANIGNDFYDCFKTKDRLKMPEPFLSKWGDISSYITGRHTKDGWGGEVQRVALESLNQVQTPGVAAEADAKPQFKLNLRTFHVSLEGLLYANGLGCSIAWEPESVKRDNPTPRVARLDVATLNMGEIGGASQLWTDLMKNTFDVDKGSDEKNRLQPRVRTYLQARGPVWGIWDRSQFALSSSVKREILEIIAKTGETLKAEDLPLPEIYLSPKPMGAKPAIGYIGLLLGTYQGQTGANKSVERESHHTTQFLLLEYFRNWQGFKPFKHTLSIYPGLVPGTKGPAEYKSKTGPSIKIADLTGDSESQRGPNMPAISLARVTHRRGDVHIHGEPDDLVDTEPGKRSLSQGAAVANHFRDNITDDKLREALFVGSDETPLRSKVAADRDGVQEQIHSAMQATYRWMRDDMKDRLLKGLASEEVNYYNNLATPPGATGPTLVKRLSAGEMTAVADAAALNNKAVMEANSHWS